MEFLKRVLFTIEAGITLVIMALAISYFVWGAAAIMQIILFGAFK